MKNLKIKTQNLTKLIDALKKKAMVLAPQADEYGDVYLQPVVDAKKVIFKRFKRIVYFFPGKGTCFPFCIRDIKLLFCCLKLLFHLSSFFHFFFEFLRMVWNELIFWPSLFCHAN